MYFLRIYVSLFFITVAASIEIYSPDLAGSGETLPQVVDATSCLDNSTMIVHLHIAHCGGTLMTRIMTLQGLFGSTKSVKSPNYMKRETGLEFVDKVRQSGSRWLAVEYPSYINSFLKTVPLGKPNFFFSLTLRHPLWRALAFHGRVKQSNPEVYASPQNFTGYLTSQSVSTINLRANHLVKWFSKTGRDSREGFLHAVHILSSVDVVLIIDDENPLWFQKTFQLLCKRIGLVDSYVPPKAKKPLKEYVIKHSSPEVYHSFVQENEYDLQLYSIAKQKALEQLEQYNMLQKKEKKLLKDGLKSDDPSRSDPMIHGAGTSHMVRKSGHGT